MTVASQVKQTLASIKGVQGTLRIYSAQLTEDKTKNVFDEAIEVTEEIIHDLEQRVQVLEFQEPQYKGN